MDLRMLVQELTHKQMDQIISEWNQFERDGVIGDCLLRRLAKNEIDKAGLGVSRITTVMRDITFEVFRRMTFELQNEMKKIEDASNEMYLNMMYFK